MARQLELGMYGPICFDLGSAKVLRVQQEPLCLGELVGMINI